VLEERSLPVLRALKKYGQRPPHGRSNSDICAGARLD
jgi:hypothetical protein